jgi:hypothetical protein
VSWPVARTRRRGSWLPVRRGGAGQRGAVAVETALVTPVLLVVLLGVIELPMLIGDYVAVTSAARTGARVAAAEPGCYPLPGTPCPATDPAPFAKLAAEAVARNGTALAAESIRYVLVYKANTDGYPGSLSSMPGSCAGVTSCIGYSWNAASGAFVQSSGSWDRRTVNACFPSNVDSVGVQVVADHEFLSGLLGTTLTMSEHAVMNFEPLKTGSCVSGSHS